MFITFNLKISEFTKSRTGIIELIMSNRALVKYTKSKLYMTKINKHNNERNNIITLIDDNCDYKLIFMIYLVTAVIKISIPQ